jgi:hypothetical protein
MQIMGIRRWETNVKKEHTGRESLKRLKPIMGCNASKRRKRRYSIFTKYSLNPYIG